MLQMLHDFPILCTEDFDKERQSLNYIHKLSFKCSIVDGYVTEMEQDEDGVAVFVDTKKCHEVLTYLTGDVCI